MEKKNIVSMVLTLLILACVIYGGWFFLKTYVFKSGVAAGFLEVSGRMEGREHNAGTKVGGRVEEVFVSLGDSVKAGTPIGKIDSKQLEALFTEAEAKLKEAEANFKLAELEFKRYESLYEQKAVPKVDYDVAENKYTVAKESVVVAQKQLEKVKADLDDTTVRAPITGVVISKIVHPGEVVAAGTPLVTMVNMDDLYLKVFLSTELAGKVSIGNEAKIFPDAMPKEEFEAVVEKIGEKAEFTPKNVETKSQRAKLVFEIRLSVKKNKAYLLKPGMPCDAVIKINNAASWAAYKRH